MIVRRTACLVAALALIIGAMSNTKFYFGQMGGGPSERPMPTWVARVVILAIASLFVWYALIPEP
jgi:hypothetical protein